MALGHSPQTVTDGLVFYYDMDNPQKSWKGAPTTNVIQTNLNLYDKDNGCTVTQLPETFEGNPIYRVVFPAGTLPRIRTTFAYTAGQQYTGSIYYKVVSQGSHTPQLIFRENGFGTTYTSVSLTGTSWQRTNITHTFSGSGTSMFLLYQSNSAATTPTIIDFSMPQTELRSFATPFVNGTRSNTQAIVDLTNNNTVTANSLTYNADGSFGFNGTNNELTSGTTTIAQTPNITTEAWVRRTGSNTMGFIIGNGTTGPNGYWLSLGSSGLTFSVGNGTSGFQQNAGTISNDTIHHVCGTYDGTSNKIYVNGSLVATNTSISGPINYTSVPQNFKIGNLNGSGTAVGRWFQGNIFSAKIYNRALSAAEVQQNFNALRGRYGL